MKRDERMGGPRSTQRRWHWPPASLLATLEDAARNRLLQSGTVREYPADQVLMRMGDQTTFVITLIEGIVKATGLTAEGKEVLLAVRVGGDLVGEFAALDNRPRSSTVTTCGLVLGCVIAQPDFLGLLRRDESLARAVDRTVLGKLRFANERRVEFAGFDAYTRVARVLRELAAGYGDRDGDRVTLGWPLTQSELASLSSVAEPTVQKVLRRLRDAGIISTGYRALTIESFNQLNAAAGP
jgi:CRP/FNR family cyclic AMP-dependent transcriptional regulator